MKKIGIFLGIATMHLLTMACSIGDDPDPGVDASTAVQGNTKMMNITIGDQVLTATMAENTSVDALMEVLSEGPISIDMRDYGNMEKVGSFGRDFPRNDESITAEAGDLILYQGSAFVIYYAPNSWSFTRLGKIDGLTAGELKAILGKGDVRVTLSLPEN